jgi:hypothetical protein
MTPEIHTGTKLAIGTVKEIKNNGVLLESGNLITFKEAENSRKRIGTDENKTW